MVLSYPKGAAKSNASAGGIVCTIGWVNFLKDRSQTPQMKLTAIDNAFGVGESTGKGKSMLIRKVLKTRPTDPGKFTAKSDGQEPVGLDDPSKLLPGGCPVLETGDSRGSASQRVDFLYLRKAKAFERRG